jgi:Flp pilus assembly pilin Flp
MRTLNLFLIDEQATETVEWGILAGFLVGGLVLTLAAIASWVQGSFTQIKTEIGA